MKEYELIALYFRQFSFEEITAKKELYHIVDFANMNLETVIGDGVRQKR
ncbi:hypothetical protein H5P36_19590 [Bacillus sp. APMAM]|nr:hypothetical protein [Bacillus sp. APMAM]